MRASRGSISATLMVTILSGVLNIVQGAYNIRYFKADKSTQALNNLIVSDKKDESDFQKEFNAALEKMKKQIQRLYLPDAQDLKATIEKLASDRDSMVQHVNEREKIYRATFNKSYASTNLSWANSLSLDTRAKAELRQRYSEILQRKDETNELSKLFAFADAADSEWTMVTTRQDANVRSSPNKNASVVTAIPKDSVGSVVSVNADRSWVEIKGKAPNSFDGWVYVRLLRFPNTYFLN